jgi:mono/diheme cytochrome c family protein
MRLPAWQQERSDSQLEDAVRKGRQGGMPPFEGALAPDEIRSLVGYIRALK